MKQVVIITIVAAFLAIGGNEVEGGNRFGYGRILFGHSRNLGGQADQAAAWRAAQTPWHGPYYHTEWGQPLALVVPPTAHMQSSWSWGAAQTEMVPIYHQFGRAYPGYVQGAYPLLPTPRWPSHTDQFGVYHVRGPW